MNCEQATVVKAVSNPDNENNKNFVVEKCFIKYG